MTNRLPAWSLFAALIAMAGLPIYIHAPKFYRRQLRQVSPPAWA
jgi:hypothetical protein